MLKIRIDSFLAAVDYMEVVETAQADKKTVDYRKMAVDNCFVEVGILLYPLLYLFHPNILVVP
jgi:hypothetical protein